VLLMGSGSDTSSARFSFVKGQLILQTDDAYPGETIVRRMYFDRYNGTLPPAHWPAVLTADAFEPDSVPALAKPIAAGQTQAHTLTQKDVDWYSLKATAGTTYTISTGGRTDTYLQMYDTAAAVVLDSSDDISDEDYNAQLSWSCLQSGTYIFKIGGYDADFGIYAISVKTGTVTKRMAGLGKLSATLGVRKPHNYLTRRLR
jgi:hypothetical protein